MTATNIKEMLYDLQHELDQKYSGCLDYSVSKVNRVYIRGDVHGDFDWLNDFCERENTTPNDVMILAGDSGLLFYGKGKTREKLLKDICHRAPITLLVVRGNHDNRPTNEDMTLRWNDLVQGNCYWEDEYPNILYAGDGEMYWMRYKSFLTIGGAYSVDKFYRLHMHWTWYPDEELTDEEMRKILDDWSGCEADYIITHTAPLDHEPTWLFMQGIDQSVVSKRMEKFLQRIKNCVNYKCWIWGHYHDDHYWGRLEEDTPMTIDDPAHIMLMNDIVLAEEPEHNGNPSIIDTGIVKYVI